MVKIQYLGATNLWVVVGNLVMGWVSAALLPLPVQKNSPGGGHRREGLRIKVIISLHGIKRAYRKKLNLRAYAKVVKGSESYCF